MGAASCPSSTRDSPSALLIVVLIAQGQTIQVIIHQSTPHYGRFELRVCPLTDASLDTEYNQLSDACLDAHQLILAPNSTQVSYLAFVALGLSCIGRKGDAVNPMSRHVHQGVWRPKWSSERPGFADSLRPLASVYRCAA